MSNQVDDNEKTHDPTEKKLRDARNKGEIVRSNDVTTAASYMGFWIGLTLFGSVWIHNIGNTLILFLDRPVELSQIVMRSSPEFSIGLILSALSPPIIAWFSIPGCVVILALLAQRSLVFAPSKVTPKISRISIISNAKNKFGRAGIFEFIKSFLKLILYSLALGFFIYVNLDNVMGSVHLHSGQISIIISEMSLSLLLLITIISIGLGLIDYVWQYFDFMRKNRMSHKEIQDEQKESEGDPHFKAQRRVRAQEIAMNRMMADVPSADVIIVNPTHYAVALQWDNSKAMAPICVAKGKDQIAHVIRETALEFNIPIHSDPPTARAIFANVEIGQEVSPDLYGPVAIAIRFARDTRSKNKFYS